MKYFDLGFVPNKQYFFEHLGEKEKKPEKSGKPFKKSSVKLLEV